LGFSPIISIVDQRLKVTWYWYDNKERRIERRESIKNIAKYYY
jgi:hypothetical protein